MADLRTSTESPVYLGVWTNWSQGQVSGLTLTLSHRNGAFLTAFLALFVTVTGTSLWRISKFVLHQYLSANVPGDGLYHQRQAVLRNTTSGVSSIISLVRILMTWRYRARRPIYRVLPLVMIIVVYVVGFMAASILSAKLGSQMGDEVLVKGPTCGKLRSKFLPTTDGFSTTLDPFLSKDMESSLNYAQRCYTNDSDTDACRSFVKQQLFRNVDRNASCPFRKEICRHQDRNIRLDTGPIDSHLDLGMNSPSSLRMTLSHVTHCAPLVTNGYKQKYSYSDDISYVRYYYGRPVEQSTYVKDWNFTYEYQQLSIPPTLSEGSHDSLTDYTLGYVYFPGQPATKNNDPSLATVFPVNGSIMGNIVPIDELLFRDRDVFLVFLSANSIQYNDKVDDDWYAAHQLLHRLPTYGPSTVFGSASYYVADEPASVLGCTIQHQICDLSLPSGKACTEPGGQYDVYEYSNVMGENVRTMSLWITRLAYLLDSVVGRLRSTSLTSRYTQNGPIQPGLPENQWQLDVENWHSIALASLQQSVVTAATGVQDADIRKDFWHLAETKEEKRFCKNQKIRSAAYANFSVLTLAMILIVGGFIIIFGNTLENIIYWIDGRRSILKHSRLEWTANGVLQTQRLAHEELGIGTWEGCAGTHTVPVLKEKGKLLAVLDTGDPEHPRLKLPDTPADDMDAKLRTTCNSTDIGTSGDNTADWESSGPTEGNRLADNAEEGSVSDI